MTEEYRDLNPEEKLKAENDFMKMKIMIEHGGHFVSDDSSEQLPAEIENEFLSNIIEFEKQFAERKTITVFERIGKPVHFKPDCEISDEDITSAWKNLSSRLNQFGVDLTACSPRITARELYHFTLDELFKCEIDDINIPGLMNCFIYDEFYPDHEYDNSRAATQDCIRLIFDKQPFEWTYQLAKIIHLNDHSSITKDEVAIKINRFKDSYDEIVLDHINVASSTIADKVCEVKGNYSAHARFGNELVNWAGGWRVDFALDEELGFWHINNVQIEGIPF